MSEKDIENKLKKQAKKVKMQSFSERYKALENELYNSQSQDFNMNGNLKAKSRKKQIAIIGATFIALLVIISILAFCFSKSNNLYYSIDDIFIDSVNQDEFDSKMAEAEIYPQVDLSSHYVYGYSVYYFNDKSIDNIQGGCFSILDEDESGDAILMADIKFYTTKVVLDEIDYDLATDMDSITIYFKISETDDWQWQAEIVTEDLIYRIDFVNIDGEEQSFIEFLNDIL